MSNVRTLSPQELKDLNYVLSLSEPGKHQTLDFSDEIQYRYYLNGVTESGMTPDKYPQFFKTLESSRRQHLKNNGPILSAVPQISDSNDLVNVNLITSAIYNTAASLSNSAVADAQSGIANTIVPNSSTASAVSSVVGGTLFTKLRLQIIDTLTGAVLADTNPPAVYGSGEYLTIDSQGNPPSASSLSVIFTYSYQQKTGQPPVTANVFLNLSEEACGIPTVSAPVQKPEHSMLDYIKFGIGRDKDHTPPDCDYIWNEPNINDPIVRLPLVGGQTFASDIVSPPTANDIVCYLMLVQKGGGGAPITPTTQLLSGIGISPTDPKTLNWNFSYNYDMTIDKSIQFGKATFNPDSQVVLFFQVQVKTKNGGSIPVSTCVYGATRQSPTDPPPSWSPSPKDQPGIFVMRPFLYTWHCVAADTKITLANGTTKRIDALKGGDALVTNAKGDVFRVVDTVFADKSGKCRSITDEFGHTLRITANHTVVTTEGIKLAKNLKAGDFVVTEKGNARLVSVEWKRIRSRVWSISLGYDDNETEKLNDENRTFYANGILIGDSRMSFTHSQHHRKTLEAVLSKLPIKWHQDAMNSRKHYDAMGVKL